MQLACAAAVGCNLFLTNDDHLSKLNVADFGPEDIAHLPDDIAGLKPWSNLSVGDYARSSYEQLTEGCKQV